MGEEAWHCSHLRQLPNPLLQCEGARWYGTGGQKEAQCSSGLRRPPKPLPQQLKEPAGGSRKRGEGLPGACVKREFKMEF